MKDHSMKFIFLAVVIAAVLFSRFAYPAPAPAATSLADVENVGAATVNGSSTPLFTLPPSAISATSATGNSATTTTQQTPPTPGRTAPPQVGATASLVADLETGTIFESVSAGSRWPTASITKLMTATIAEDQMSPTTTISITQNMFAADPTESTLVVGGTYDLNDLLHVMLMPSSNVAAEAIADFYGRSQFLMEMNLRAQAWGMRNTYFGDPSGLSSTNQSTANDLFLLAQKIYNNYPGIFAIARTPQVTITEENSGARVPVKSIDIFAGEPDFVGGKTGFTDDADGNLLSVFRFNGKSVAIIVLGTNDRFGDTQTLYSWFKANYQ